MSGITNDAFQGSANLTQGSSNATAATRNATGNAIVQTTKAVVWGVHIVTHAIAIVTKGNATMDTSNATSNVASAAVKGTKQAKEGSSRLFDQNTNSLYEGVRAKWSHATAAIANMSQKAITASGPSSQGIARSMHGSMATSRAETVNSRTIQPIARTAPPIDLLPKELLEPIFSSLKQHDLPAIASVNKTMKTSVITAANYSEPTSIKNFIQLLIQSLNVETFPVQRNFLTEISQNITPQNFANLLLLKDYILDVKKQLINVIKTLDAPTANDLRDHIQLPMFMEDIFELSAIERQIDEANLIPNERTRGFALQDISKALAPVGNLERAIAVVTSISDERVRGLALRDISEALTQAGKIDRAIAIATSIPVPEEHLRGLALCDISKALTQAGNIGRAFAVAMSIPEEQLRRLTLREICNSL